MKKLKKLTMIALGLIVVGFLYVIILALVGVDYETFGMIGVYMIIAGILYFIIKGIAGVLRFFGIGSNSRNDASIVAAVIENRKNHPNKCISCTYFLSKGECRQTGKSTGEMDSCNNWC